MIPVMYIDLFRNVYPYLSKLFSLDYESVSEFHNTILKRNM